MRRRELMLGGVVTAAAGRPAIGQASRERARIGWIATGPAIPRKYFDQAMRQLGWIEGENLLVDRRVTGTNPADRLKADKEVIAANPDAIVAIGTLDAIPIRSLTGTIPIVLITAANLEESGLVESFRRHGGNVTGLSMISSELDGKRLELLHELIPEARQVGMLGSHANAGDEARFAAAAVLAQSLGIGLQQRTAAHPEELDAAFAASAAAGDQAILVPFVGLTFENQPRVLALAARYRLPAVYEVRDYVENGGLISFGPDFHENFKRAAVLVDKILKGANPAELPIERPTRFELIINRKISKELGLAIPPLVFARADEILE